MAQKYPPSDGTRGDTALVTLALMFPRLAGQGGGCVLETLFPSSYGTDSKFGFLVNQIGYCQTLS